MQYELWQWGQYLGIYHRFPANIKVLILLNKKEVSTVIFLKEHSKQFG